MKRKSWLLPLVLLGLLTLFFLWGLTGYPHSAQLPSGDSLEAPSPAHWLGTDNLGVDIYAQLSAGYFRSMGIGLSVCRTVVRAHGGHIRGENRTEGGARFTVELPLDKEIQQEVDSYEDQG